MYRAPEIVQAGRAVLKPVGLLTLP